MQDLHRARRAVVYHDDRLASGEEIVKKKRLETSKKMTYQPPYSGAGRATSGFNLRSSVRPIRVEYESFAYPFTLSSPLLIFMLFVS
jgi:hypothetical protein